MREAAFDWGEKGEAYWRALAASVKHKPSETTLRFFVLKQSMMTDIEAARLVGIKNQKRLAQEGHRIKHSVRYRALEEALDALERPEVAATAGGTMREKALVGINKMLESLDPMVNARGSELLLKYEAAEAASKVEPRMTMEQILRGFLAEGAPGALAAASLYLKQSGTLIGMPAPVRVAILATVKSRYPEAWADLIDGVTLSQRHHINEIEALGSQPAPDLSEYQADTLTARGTPRADEQEADALTP